MKIQTLPTKLIGSHNRTYSAQEPFKLIFPDKQNPANIIQLVPSRDFLDLYVSSKPGDLHDLPYGFLSTGGEAIFKMENFLFSGNKENLRPRVQPLGLFDTSKSFRLTIDFATTLIDSAVMGSLKAKLVVREDVTEAYYVRGIVDNKILVEIV